MKTTFEQSNKKNKSTLTIPNEIWDLTKEIKKNLKELSASQKATDQQITKLSSELSASQRETDRQMKETDRQMKETDRQMKETDRQMKETDKKLRAYIGDSGNRWGKLGENLVKGQLTQRLNEKGIQAERVITNLKNRFSEFDLVVINGKEVVVVEVKATLDPSDVEEFTEDIAKFKTWWPEFKNKKIYGAMAFLIKANKQANHLAQKRGFFVIEATGDVIIQNKKTFKPKSF